MTAYVFAYGSNLCFERMRERAPSARPLACAALPGHELIFHKRGRDGSAKADCYWTGRQGDVVHGVVYRMSRSDKRRLDSVEGRGVHYLERRRELVAAGGGTIEALLYHAHPRMIASGLLPYRWYRELVILGASAHGLPAAYLRRLGCQAAIADPDPERRRRALAAVAACG